MGPTKSSASSSFLRIVGFGSRTLPVVVFEFTVVRVVPIAGDRSDQNAAVFGNVSAELVPTAFETRATMVSTRVSATASLVYVPARSILTVPPRPTVGAVSNHAASGTPLKVQVGVACSTRSTSRTSESRASITVVLAGITEVMVKVTVSPIVAVSAVPAAGALAGLLGASLTLDCWILTFVTAGATKLDVSLAGPVLGTTVGSMFDEGL